MIPSLVGRMPHGKSRSHPLAETGGSETVTLTTAQMASHTHSSTISINEAGEHTHNFKYGGVSVPKRNIKSIYDSYYKQQGYVGGDISARGK